MLLAVILALFSGGTEDSLVQGIVVIAIGLAAILTSLTALHMDQLSQDDANVDTVRLLRRAVPLALRTLVIVIGVVGLIIAVIVGAMTGWRTLLN